HSAAGSVQPDVRRMPIYGEGCAPPPAEPPGLGRRVLHVEEETARAAPRCHLALTLLGDLAGFLAVLAAHRERQRAQTLLANLLAAFVAVAVGALLGADDCIVDLVERLRLHLDEREFELFLDVGFRALDSVEDLVQLAAPRPLFADATHLALNFGLDLAPPL